MTKNSKYLYKIAKYIFLFCSITAPSLSISSELLPVKEAVMEIGMQITAYTKHGEFVIKANSDTERTYTWDGKSMNVNLVPRQNKWHGKLGLLDPNNIHPPHENVVHVVIEECQIHYDSVTNVIKSMNSYEDIEDLYRDDGLFVRFQKNLLPENGKYAVDISVYQILVNGKKPTKLPGSQNHKIIVNKDT